MRIGSVTMENYREMMRIFDTNKQSRLGDIKNRVRSESGKWDHQLFSGIRQQVRGPMGRSMTVREWDDALSALDPNHIRGLGTSSGVNGVGGPPPPRMLNLPDHMVQGIQDLARLQFAQIFSGASDRRMQHGDELGMLNRSFVREFAEHDRLDAMYSFNRVFQNERLRIESEIQRAMPNWQRGMRVPAEIQAAILNGGSFDARA